MQTNAYPVGELHVRYDRKLRLWELWQNLDVIGQFERGTEGKRDAFLSAIDKQNQWLGQIMDRMIVKNPPMKSRIIRAGIMIMNNHWLPARGDVRIREVARIQSQSDTEVYHTIQVRPNNFFVCSCEDFQYGKAPAGNFGQLYCAHILAHLIHLKLNRQPILPATTSSTEERIHA